MEYKDIRIGQRLLLRGALHGVYEAEVVAVDPRRQSRASEALPLCGDAIQIRTVLGSLLWVNPSRLMESDR